MEESQCKQIGDYYYYLSSKPIGKGTFATVYKGYVSADSTNVVAIKIINAQTLQEYKEFSELFDRETDILLKIKGPHVLELKKILKSGSGNLYIVTSYCEGGSLEQLINKEGNIPEKRALKILKEVCEAFVEIESLGLTNAKGEKMLIMHRDIKPGNILFQNEVTKLADFGFAKLIEEGKKNVKLRHTALGSPSYMSPQILEQQEYSYKCDIWSMGVVLFEIVVGKLPWYSSSTYELLQKIKKIPLNIPSSVSKECRDLLEKMLMFEESERIDWQGILKHPAITGKTEEPPKFNQPSKIDIVSLTTSQSTDKSGKLQQEDMIKPELKTSQSKSGSIEILSISKGGDSNIEKQPSKKSKIKFLDE